MNEKQRIGMFGLYLFNVLNGYCRMSGTSALKQLYVLFGTVSFNEVAEVAVRNKEDLALTIFSALEDVTQTSQTVLSEAVVLI